MICKCGRETEHERTKCWECLLKEETSTRKFKYTQLLLGLALGFFAGMLWGWFLGGAV